MRPAEAKAQQRLHTDGGPRTGAIQRAFDILSATMGLLMLAPLMLIIAIAIRTESEGPVFFSHVRLGAGGKRFRMHKFRKFHEDGATGGTAVTLQGDDRMTRVGRLLARTKLDELPQLWNILKGEMAVVGPRPEALAFADCFDDRFRKVLDFRPGIFGPNQIFFRNESVLYRPGIDPERFYRDVLFPLKARADLAYFPYRTVRRDLVWVARGIGAVLGLRSSCKRGWDPLASVETWTDENQRRQGRA